MVPPYGPLETIQLLSETFLFAGLSFRVIWLPKLKWVTLYISSKIIFLKNVMNLPLNNTAICFDVLQAF